MCAKVSENAGFSCDHYLEGLEKSTDRESFGLEVGELLYGIHMYDYIPVFRKYNIGIDLFLALNEDDLRELGIKDCDVGTIITIIKCLQQESTTAGTENVKNAHVGVEPEPKMSMRSVLIMQCYNAKQLKQIRKMVDIIENKLKGNKFNNTLFDTDYCAAHALKIVCTELARQADILLEESNNLVSTLQKNVHRDKVKRIQRNKMCLWAGVFAATLAPMAVVLWRSLRK